MSPKGTGQGQSPQNEDNAERDKVAPALLTETETQHDTLDLEQAAVEKKDNGNVDFECCLKSKTRTPD